VNTVNSADTDSYVTRKTVHVYSRDINHENQRQGVIQISVQDQVNEKSVALVIKSGKLTSATLAKAMKIFMNGGSKLAKKLSTPKNYQGKGKQSVKHLTKQGAGVSNIEISDKNIKSFETVARKYGVDFALKKDTTETTPKWLVFFKSRDADALTSAFKEFSAKQVKHSTHEKPSVIKNLRSMSEKVQHQVHEKTKQRSKGRGL
jgi:hypothetical protein